MFFVELLFFCFVQFNGVFLLFYLKKYNIISINNNK